MRYSFISIGNNHYRNCNAPQKATATMPAYRHGENEEIAANGVHVNKQCNVYSYQQCTTCSLDWHNTRANQNVARKCCTSEMTVDQSTRIRTHAAPLAIYRMLDAGCCSLVTRRWWRQLSQSPSPLPLPPPIANTAVSRVASIHRST